MDSGESSGFTFQKIVIFVATVFLILMLIVIGIAMYKNRNNYVFPPVVPECPDYWVDESSNGSGKKCVNVKNLGNESCPKTMDFSTSTWSGDRGLCNKSKWAKACGLTWDGVTNLGSKC